MTAPTVLLAPDKFKGSLTAQEVADALAAGILETCPRARLLTCPIADGGDGTVDAAVAAGFTRHARTITGPTGEDRATSFALREGTAVLELADAVGLAALPGGRLAPRTASTRGLGELIAAAVDAGASTVIVGLGGSSSTDAGAGLLQGLGARLTTAEGEGIGPGAAGLAQLDAADLAPALAALEGVRLIAANDVTNPLLGPDGAAAVYGPQKGITEQEIAEVDGILAAAAALLDLSGQAADQPGAGAAGGTGFALTLLGAAQQAGADVVLELAGFDEQLARADVVVLGEGKLDEQTLQGKGPAEVARRAAARAARVIAVAGAVTIDDAQLRAAGIVDRLDLMSLAESTEDAIARAAELLRRRGRDIGRLLDDAPEPAQAPGAALT